MSENQRNRSQGWKYAKITGHENEKNVTGEVLDSNELRNRILNVAHKIGSTIMRIEYGGLNEKDVDCVLGGKTKSKSDMMVYLDDGDTIGISIKKSLSGQVYLIGTDRFIEGYEKQYNAIIPDDVKEAIKLYWRCSEKTDYVISEFSNKNKVYEKRKHRIVATTLKSYSSDLYDCLINWFNDNIKNIFDFCFSKGLVIDDNKWSKIIWYKNDVDEVDVDVMINIDDAKKCLKENCVYGIRTGGSTIQLPFGFVQWHSPTKKIPGDMQFHHKYNEIIDMIKEYCKENDCEYLEKNPTLRI